MGDTDAVEDDMVCGLLHSLVSRSADFQSKDDEQLGAAVQATTKQVLGSRTPKRYTTLHGCTRPTGAECGDRLTVLLTFSPPWSLADRRRLSRNLLRWLRCRLAWLHLRHSHQ